MNYRNTNKNIITIIFALALLLVCTANIVSCGGDNEDTMFPEYTGDLWTLQPEDPEVTVEGGHIVVESDDNVINGGFFTDPVSQNTETTVSDDTDVISDSGSANSEVSGSAETTVHVISPYDGVHFWPSDEFDESGYRPLKPVTTAVK